ncbi:molybdopterin-dependent oxidoreductase [Haloplanus pelagicus]|jgi:DMSO/TMAO reductase YedYZ molybdopterin-dependent catalytic subunit|uniref:molybdopterin-dependent oxidoreductase n=1 Tax=Haloplanus pelagicus TaxID=2949995 RepID=UPI00203C6A51|nr:molybdopterin-dependent oxidoreductase [Haloplanus sp. HW8-1]
MAHSDPPDEADPDRWTVTVEGAVAEPLSASVTVLGADASMRSATACAGNRAPDRSWRGVRVGTILDRVDPAPEATHGLVRSADPDYACGFDLGRLRGALLATRLAGEAIPTGRGGPVRLLVPDADCWERVKWVTRIDVLTTPPGDADTARDRVAAED